MHGGTVITVDYSMHRLAERDRIRLNDTTLYYSIKEAKRFFDIFLPKEKRIELFQKRLYEILKQESHYLK